MLGTESLSAPERRLWEREESTFAGDEISNTAHQQISPSSGGGGELNSDGSDGVRGAGLSSWVGSVDHTRGAAISGDAQIRGGRNRPGGETGARSRSPNYPPGR
ncbi:hypothetical protein ACQJBY_009619 [Aegilops geniculata]